MDDIDKIISIALFIEKKLKALAPIRGLSFPDPLDKATWRIEFEASACAAQKKAALDFVKNFDGNVPNLPDKTKLQRLSELLQPQPPTKLDQLKEILERKPDLLAKLEAL